LLISEKELRQNHRVQFQFIEMIHPNRLENDSIMAPVAQEADIIELSLEQLEGIQGGRGWRWFFGHVTNFFTQIAEAIGNTVFSYDSSSHSGGI
jgi:hypothetical protein